MRSRMLAAAALVAFVTAAGAQVVPAFEVASVKASPSANRGGEGGARQSIEFTPATLTMRNVDLRSCIRWAYDLREFQIVAPGWLATEHFDILAKASNSVELQQLRLMLQNLLERDFQLAVHHEAKQLPVYALRTTGRGAKLQPSKTTGTATMRPMGGALEFRNVSMADLADRLPSRPFGFDRPVIDRTELSGAFDFTMKLAQNDAELKSSLEQRESSQDTSLFTGALRDLGLRLQPEKGPVDILVVDHVEKTPVEN
ncbi:MAG TPA: TIGR03435 family protein [Bryobacteraceae bacterium]|nr:TIGR03435 family protein [Bryobacteraceae bacterium]